MASECNFGASHAFEASSHGLSASPPSFFTFRGFLAPFTRHYLYFIKMFWYFVGIAVISAIVILHRSKTVGESDSDSEWEAEPGQILNADVYNPFARFNS